MPFAILRRPQRGTTLVEAVIALAVMAAGMLALAGLQGSLRQQAELSRQRSEALHLAREQLEVARQQADAGGLAALADTPPTTNRAPAGQTLYAGARRVAADASMPLTLLRAEMRWSDRSGRPQALALHSALAGVPPALSGALALDTGASPLPRPLGRHPAIPREAVQVGAGRSALRPAAHVAWVFDHADGRITGVCEGLAADAPLDAASVAGCADNADAQLLSGHVRFLGPDGEPTQPTGTPRNLDLQLMLSSGGHPAPGAVCFDDAPPSAAQAVAARIVRYHCLIHANASRRWSGRAEIVPRAFVDAPDGTPWALGAQVLVCRYRGDGQSSANPNHPARYADVQGPLAHQNFLVVPSSQGCPADATTVTALHQP